jgi:nucleoside-diphosphate-sugar epimerase
MAAVLLTGASGFVGIHVLRQLLDQGHQVRAFVRAPDKLRRNLLLVGVDADDPRLEAVQGDMTNAHAVGEAAAGCERVIHTAATFSYRRRDAERMLRENVAGTMNVLDAAAEAGCTSVVHVSSTFALLQPNATVSGVSPLGVVLGPYTQTKVDSERIARERQAGDAPLCIVNPGSVVGPNDPYLGESNTVVRDVLRGRLPTWPKGRLQWVDVRDTAEVIVAALDQPGRRYVVPGETVALPHEALRRVTGRRLPAVRVPVQAATPMLKLGYRTEWPLIPYALEGARGIAMGTKVDYSDTVIRLGIKGRSLDESLTDTIRWLVETGRISRRAAGRSLDPATDRTGT